MILTGADVVNADRFLLVRLYEHLSESTPPWRTLELIKYLGCARGGRRTRELY
jgi:hypothetical protein